MSSPPRSDAERIADGLSQEGVLASILNATFVRTKRSSSLWRKKRQERIYIIESFTNDGVLIHTKGVMRKQEPIETFYIIVSAKRSTFGE